MEAQIDQLYDTLLRIDQEKNNKDLLAWLENVCQRQFGLVDGLVANFVDNIDDPVFAKKILKVLKKLNEFLPELVVPQFLNNQKFPGAIITYLSGTDMKDIAGDAFILLVNVFNDSSVDYVNDQFIKQIVSSMEFIKDENTTDALISILVILCAAIEKKKQKQIEIGGEGEEIKNLALQEFLDNEGYYREKLLYLTNSSNLYRFDKCLETVSIILSNELSEEFFNTNDLSLLLDICLREIERETSEITRVQILRMIETILNHYNYKKYPYKLDEVKSTVNGLILYEDESNGGGYSHKEKECLSKLNLILRTVNFNQ